ncbi:MAG TPA: peptide chain release factor 1 [Gemmataceae bacterium]|jgi:peptide chain release factor 1|nr:peptide chain release factor 1 [Gemmataceae bacterium]
MWNSLDQNLERYHELEQQMADPAVIAEPARFTRAVKEHGRLAKVVKPYQTFQKLDKEIAQAESMLATESDGELRQMAEEELAGLKQKRDALKQQLEDMLLESSDENYDSVIVEIRAGTGGDEAALFAGDLYNMYTRFARDQGWHVEDIASSPGEMGGFKEVVFSITGDGAFQAMRFESGGHRVQRVPKTETQGRIHTSAATVAIMPEPDEAQISIRPDDLEWERMRAGGAGGQHVNKTESAVRIWYKRGTSEELEVKCQDERSQHKNRERAMRVLRSRLYERTLQKLHQERSEQRRTLIGSGGRNDRIRTYNFPQNRITDHRIGLTLHKLDAIVAGNLGEVVAALKEFDKKQRLGQE